MSLVAGRDPKDGGGANALLGASNESQPGVSGPEASPLLRTPTQGVRGGGKVGLARRTDDSVFFKL